MSSAGIAAAREEVVRYARRMEQDGLIVATSGNLSIRDGSLLAITPSGVDYARLTPDLITVCDLDGRVVEGGLAPSSELPMHLAVYALGNIGAVVHTHSTFATVVSTLVDELPPIHYLVALFGGRIRVAPYATYGTEELAQAVRSALNGRSGALLANHGAITVGDTVEQAYTRARYLEWLAEVYYRAARGGSPRILDDDEVERVRGKVEHYGQDPRV